MKSLLATIFFLFAALIPSLEAATSHQSRIEGSDITITVVQPEGFLEEEVDDMDLVFQDPNDKGHKLAFHYFSDPQFDLKSLSEVLEYTDWLVEHFFANSKKTQTSFSSNNDYAVRSFKVTDMGGTPTYCHIYVGKIAGELVFASFSTSYASFEKAIEGTELFLKGVFWEKNKK